MTEYRDIDSDTADRVIERLIESRGDEVIRFKRVGATPYMRYTPYENHRGTIVNMWSCISICPKAMPQKTLLFHPRIVDPSEHDDYELRMFTSEWVWYQVFNSRLVEVLDAEETPFKGNMMEWVE